MHQIDWNKVFEEYYNKLNKQQRQAVDTIDGVVVVNAGPGTGKTQLLALRIANILRLTDVAPYNILCLSFSEAAAKNMRERLAKMIGNNGRKVAVFTFHGFGNEIINQNPDYFFQGLERQAIDDVGQQQILRQIFQTLPYDEPLRVMDPSKSFGYLKSALSLIANLKRNSFTPENFAMILDLNNQYLIQLDQAIKVWFDEFSPNHKITTVVLPNLEILLSRVKELKNPYQETDWQVPFNNYLLYHCNLPKQIEDTLKIAIDDCLELGKTKDFTTWKNQYLEKDDDGKLTLKELNKLEKQRIFGTVFAKYQEQLNLNNLFDYEDMLLKVIEALEHPTKKSLRYNLQERFQYILVDEFQDTNGVQMRLLRSILDSEVNEGNPNVLVVGDGDQSIYKFQGAAINNINEFTAQFKRATTINLTVNYRSTQEILDLAHAVVLESKDRPEKSKLVAYNKN